MASTITPDQVRDYLFQVYFGDYRDPFKAAVKRAYLTLTAPCISSVRMNIDKKHTQRRNSSSSLSFNPC